MTRMSSLTAGSSLRTAQMGHLDAAAGNIRAANVGAVLAAVVIAMGIGLSPSQAYAQDSFEIGASPASSAPVMPPLTNWVTVGGQYNTSGSSYLGRFNGEVNPGFYGIGDFHYGYRDPWNSGGTTYFITDGANMGLPDRSFSAKVGQQGTWGLSFDYQGIPYYANPIQSVYQSNGLTVPGVPAGSISVAYPNTPSVRTQGHVDSLWLPAATPGLGNQLYTYNLGTLRDVFTGAGKFQIGDWTITGSIRHDHKTGYQSNSLEIGGTVGLTTAGSLNNTTKPAAVTSGLAYFAQPIDYEMDRYDITAAYTTQRVQVQIGYTYSNFTDNNSVFNAQNPFAFGTLTSFAVGANTPTAAMLTAPYSLPPSNSAHQIKLMLGYNVTPTMRLNANFQYGVQLQNAQYVNGTGDPYNNPNEPRSSFDGLVQTLYGNVGMTAQPLPKLDVRLAYTIDNRDNQSPSNNYLVDTRSNNSTSANGDCTANGGLCTNLPFSYQHQTITAEAGYRIMPQTKVTLNDTFEDTQRTYADVSVVTQNTITAKIRSEVFDDVFGALSYSHQDRYANNYANNVTWNLLGANTTASPTNIAEPTGMLMYFEASRKHDDVKASIDLSPTHTLTTTLMAKFSKDTYPDGQYGLRNNHNVEVGPDVSWQITPAINAHAFYTFQQIYYDQTSIYTSGTNFTSTGTGYYVPWTANSTDTVHTVGVNLDWQAIQDVLKISFDYSFSYGDTAYALGDGMALVGGAIASPSTIAGLNFQTLPDVTSMLNMVQLRGEYTFRPNMTLIFGYAYERFSYKDFMQGTSSTQYANALLPGTLNPNDSVQILSAALRVRF